ncbi:MAG: carbon storage regulator [Firmicutes bacterium]|nr:carbon storage regulator [Bacillota bacterium]
MLVLSRKRGQSLVIGEGVEVFVVQVRGSGDQAVVRIGVRAPSGVRVFRRELFDEIAAENVLASQGGNTSLKELDILREVSG